MWSDKVRDSMILYTCERQRLVFGSFVLEGWYVIWVILLYLRRYWFLGTGISGPSPRTASRFLFSRGNAVDVLCVVPSPLGLMP